MIAFTQRVFTQIFKLAYQAKVKRGVYAEGRGEFLVRPILDTLHARPVEIHCEILNIICFPYFKAEMNLISLKVSWIK